MIVQSTGQILITVVAVLAGTLVTRFLPFIVFPPSRKTPKYVQYLGNVLPFAVIGLLVVYCLKDISYGRLFMRSAWTGIGKLPGIAEAVCIVSIFILHRWKRNMLLSIGAGTILYMILVQFVWVNV